MIAGDFNAWSTQRCCPSSNERGHALLESFASLNIALLTEGCQNTFEKAGTGSIIDLTLASNSLTRAAKWEVNGIYTESDHLPLSAPGRFKSRAARINGYKIYPFDKDVFTVIFDQFELKENATEKSVQLMNIIKSACDALMIRKGQTPQRHEPSYWWNENIADARKECLKARRKYQRSRDTESFSVLQEIFASKRRTLNKMFKRSKKECFHKPCDDVDVNPWGQAYRS